MYSGSKDAKNAGNLVGDQTMNEKLKDKNSMPRDEEMLQTLRRIEKHLQDLVFYTTPERAFLPSAGKASVDPIATDDNLAESKIRNLVTQEIKRYLKERK